MGNDLGTLNITHLLFVEQHNSLGNRNNVPDEPSFLYVYVSIPVQDDRQRC
jgi:hypothetical protein